VYLWPPLISCQVVLLYGKLFLLASTFSTLFQLLVFVFFFYIPNSSLYPSPICYMYLYPNTTFLSIFTSLLKIDNFISHSDTILTWMTKLQQDSNFIAYFSVLSSLALLLHPPGLPFPISYFPLSWSPLSFFLFPVSLFLLSLSWVSFSPFLYPANLKLII